MASGSQKKPAMAEPLNVQRIKQALRIEPLLNYIEDMVKKPHSDTSDSDSDIDISQSSVKGKDGTKTYNGIVTSRCERRTDKNRLYNFSKVRKSRKWLKTILLSDSSSDEDDDSGAITENDLQLMLREHMMKKKCRQEFTQNKELQQYQYYGVGMLSNYDKYYDHQKMILGPRRKLISKDAKAEKKKKGVVEDFTNTATFSTFMPNVKQKKLTPEVIAQRRKKLWFIISKREEHKAWKQKVSIRKEMMLTLKRLSKESQRECRRAAIVSQKQARDAPARGRRLAREMMVYWKRFEKVEKETRRKAEKEAMEQRKMDVGLREMKRQQRKLNFLITQTELYAHFMSRKKTGAAATQLDEARDAILHKLDDASIEPRSSAVEGGVLTDISGDNYDDSERMKSQAMANVERAVAIQQKKTKEFDDVIPNSTSSFANPAISTDVQHDQPSIFEGKLKGYQLKGMNWLANLYDQGINGILADEMGLGKTVQSIAFLAHLAEEVGIWGPFLIISPASTLHNWQQEITRFLPSFKVVPYWGNPQDRRILRKFWNQENLHSQDASFHIVVTSYQLVIQDVKYFQRIGWHYMVLDEAQAIKSTTSTRWKTLLGFKCRNRLLLTGTPIQNSMAELWALLHFIMPTMFDSHDEFNEWFSKDIETHAEKQSGIDETQLSRLHMILKPFMLRRVKKDVENELSDKIEVLMYCPMTMRQQLLYQAVKGQLSIEELMQSAFSSTTSGQAHTSLMNLVMQFRKVCNHPELFERREIRSGLYCTLDPYVIPKLIYREGILSSCVPSIDHLLYNKLNIHQPHHIHTTLLPTYCERRQAHVAESCFSFLRFINTGVAEFSDVMLKGLLKRWISLYIWWRESYRIYFQHQWQQQPDNDTVHIKTLPPSGFLLSPLRTTHYTNVSHSPHLGQLVFTSPVSTTYTHITHTIHPTRETIAHRMIRFRNYMATNPPPIPTTPTSPTKSGKGGSKKHHSKSAKQSASKTLEHHFEMFPVFEHKELKPQYFELERTDMPVFLYYQVPKVKSSPFSSITHDRSAENERQREAVCGSQQAYDSLLYGSTEQKELCSLAKYYFNPSLPQGLLAVKPKYGYSGVHIPCKETLIRGAGKLHVLDTLLARLKAEGHRVLIYSQMTRMIDILEEYMWYRKHTYMRLDGSSKISDRRDMVADFQNRCDIFVFLLSTRAGGLGINLTAADTVIFYDSDWNPTVDQQAMDRAHRLGQTKQVTVYRLICKGTIEERILERAKEKSEIQRVVMSGGSIRPDVLKPKEVVSLLLDDDNMEAKFLRDQQWRKEKSEQNKEKHRQKMKELYAKKKSEKPPSTRGPGRPRKPRKPPAAAAEDNVTIAAGSTPTPTTGGSSPASSLHGSTPTGAGGQANLLMMALGGGGGTVPPSPSQASSIDGGLDSDTRVSTPTNGINNNGSVDPLQSELWGNPLGLGLSSGGLPTVLSSASLASLGDEENDSSNDGLVIVDDPNATTAATKRGATPDSSPAPRKRGRGGGGGSRGGGTGRPRGRPRGSTNSATSSSSSSSGRRPRGRGSIRKALSAAEIAGAQAGKSAGYSAYGYSFTGNDMPGKSPSDSPIGSPAPAVGSPSTTRGAHTTPGRASPSVRGAHTPAPKRGGKTSFYTQRNTNT